MPENQTDPSGSENTADDLRTVMTRVWDRMELARSINLTDTNPLFAFHLQDIDTLHHAARLALTMQEVGFETICICGTLDWTIREHGRLTHKHICPARTDAFCQTHPDGCPQESEKKGISE